MLVSVVSTAQETPRTWLGEPVAGMLEHFRDQGYPFAWSTRLVPDDLLIGQEPEGTDPLEMVSEVLARHHLEIRQQDGIYLVVRSARAPPGAPGGSLLILLRDLESQSIDAPVVISLSPGFPAVEQVDSGMHLVRGLAPGRYRVSIHTEGFIPVAREVELLQGGSDSLVVQLARAPVELESMTISTSRYLVFSNSQFFVDQRAIENLPGNGDDPLRATHRLPGTAAGGWSAQAHFRGGEENETAIFLNGLRLLDPFHVRDYHNIFSSIDARSISGVEAWTGGFPATYGDRMSGVMLLQSKAPDQDRSHELGLSVFNTSLLTSGRDDSGRMDWLLSARRSNLSLVLDKVKHGQPDYHDLFASLGYNVSGDSRWTFNYLRASDSILAVTEHLPEEQEFSTSETRNQHAWLQFEKSWDSGLGMSAVASRSTFSNLRHAVAGDEEQLVGEVDDFRDVEINGIRVHFDLPFGRDHLLQWGFEHRHNRAFYDYRAQAAYDGFYLAYPGVPEEISRQVLRTASGKGSAAWISDRWQATAQLAIDAGIRWDRQGWLRDGDNDQVSPRLSLLYSHSADTDLRISWGHYFQSQHIQELQVEDGEDRFHPAQRADHLIAGLAHRFDRRWSLRAELFHKDYSRLRPRFENLLDPVPLIGELEPDRTRITPDSARARGLEITVEYESGSLNGWASWTLSKVTDLVVGRHERRNWDQEHAIHAGLAWSRGPWEVGLAANIHSGWPTTPARLEVDEEGEYELLLGRRNSDRLNTFINLDFRVSRAWQLPDSRLTAFFELNNALNHRNECCVDYDIDDEDEDDPVLERSVDHWLGVSPAVGLVWEF